MENLTHQTHQMKHDDSSNQHYVRLLIMTILSFIAMYILMYAMVNTFANVLPNLNQFYMVTLMLAPMIIIEIVLMWSMYKNWKINLTVVIISTVLMITSFLLIRQQTAITDKEFLRSMIPHHASAILMCEKASIDDPQIKDLCERIKSNQQSEIDEMKTILERLDE